MSTRAIIGIKNPDGSILGAWQWNDGDGLSSALNKNFNTEEKARLLISEGMWSCMFTAKEKQEYEDWLVNDLYKGKINRVKDHRYVEICGMHLLKNPNHENVEAETYKDFADAAGQDINHIYLFNAKTSRWVRNKDIL